MKVSEGILWGIATCTDLWHALVPAPVAAAGKLAIVNLQRTKHDKKAEGSGGVVIHAKTDEVLAAVMAKLKIPIPSYVRQDSVLIGHMQHKPAKRRKVATGIGEGGGRAADLNPVSTADAMGEGAVDAERAEEGGVADAGTRMQAAHGMALTARGSGSVLHAQGSGRVGSYGGGSHAAAAGLGAGNGGQDGSVEGERVDDVGGRLPFSVYVRSLHGDKCHIPMVQRVEFRFHKVCVVRGGCLPSCIMPFFDGLLPSTAVVGLPRHALTLCYPYPCPEGWGGNTGF